MSRTWIVETLAAVGILSLAAAVAGVIVGVPPVGAVGFALGSITLSMAACSHLFLSWGRVSFLGAGLAVTLSTVVTLGGTVWLVTGSVLTWAGVVTLVFVFGASLAYPLGIARTRRQRLIVVTALFVLGELFVAAAVLDRNTHLEAEGLATLAAVAVVPVFVVLAVPLYIAGSTVRRTLHDGEPSHEPLLFAAAVPWVAGVGALLVPPLLDDGLRGLSYAAVGSGAIFGVPAWMPNPGLVLFVAVGVVCYGAVHRSVARNVG